MGSRLTIVTSLPTWAVLTLAFASPVIAVMIAFLSHRAARDLEARSKREEVLRNLRWAAELAVCDDVDKARLGTYELQALRESKMLSSTEEGLIDAALRATIAVPRQAIAQSADVAAVEVVVTTGPAVTGEIPVPSEGEGDPGEGADILCHRRSS
jgi:hypothetical protein